MIKINLQWYSKKWVVVLLHVAAWTLFFSLPYLLTTPYEQKKAVVNTSDEGALAVIHRIDDGWLIFSFYLNALLLIPRLIYTKRYGTFAAIHLLLLSIFPLGNWLLFRFVAVHTPFEWRNYILFAFFGYSFILASSTAYQMIRDKIKSERLAKEKENENLKTELSFLRSQVSPHFMFNVLNNMVALARKQSDLLEPSLIKLSSLLRYMLYETDEDKVMLEKEIEYLKSYIELQSQRFGKKVQITTSFEPAYDGYVIEPMLLIPFVENAFKHGTGLVPDAQIDVHLMLEKERLDFVVRNRYTDAAETPKDKTSGIGLNNVKRRLNLLYPRSHSLTIEKEDGWFSVLLQLNLH
jgi:sensor histidine kinase YesM